MTWEWQLRPGWQLACCAASFLVVHYILGWPPQMGHGLARYMTVAFPASLLLACLLYLPTQWNPNGNLDDAHVGGQRCLHGCPVCIPEADR